MTFPSIFPSFPKYALYSSQSSPSPLCLGLCHFLCLLMPFFWLKCHHFHNIFLPELLWHLNCTFLVTLIIFYSILEFSMYLSYISYKNLNSLRARLAWLRLFFAFLQYPGHCLIFDKYLLWRWVDTLTQSSAVNKCIYTYAFPFYFHNLQMVIKKYSPSLDMHYQ